MILRNFLLKISIGSGVIVAPFFLSAATGLAAKTTPTPTTETYRDIIEKAQRLGLQGERSRAQQLLLSAMKKESRRNGAKLAVPPAEMVQALDEISNLFLSDKAQQLFEVGVSLRATDANQSLAKLNEAAKIEPEQMGIIQERTRVFILLGRCSEAQSAFEKATEMQPYFEGLQLVAAQLALCLNQFDQVKELRAAVDDKKSALLPFWSSVTAEYRLRSGQVPAAMDAADLAAKLDPAYPEAFYWQWRVERDLKRNGEAVGERYLTACKSLSARAARKYLAEPNLCRRTQEVESSLKKNNNPPS